MYKWACNKNNNNNSGSGSGSGSLYLLSQLSCYYYITIVEVVVAEFSNKCSLSIYNNNYNNISNTTDIILIELIVYNYNR